MSQELGRISFYLAKDKNTFDSVLKESKLPEQNDDFQIRSFEIDEVEARFLCIRTQSNKPNPPWIDFVNDQLDGEEEKLDFPSYSHRPSAVLLLNIDGKILAATFGASGASLLDKTKFFPDFGIKTAMNMCGNSELRQTKSRTHSITTQNIDRQISQPSDAAAFNLRDTELLKYISAHLEENKNVTLQGKDNLTVKVIGEEKLSWERLIEYCKEFLKQYDDDRYKTLFPNYPNLQEISEEKADELNEKLVELIKAKDFSHIHLAIPEFIADDEFSFSYTNNKKKDDLVFSHIHTDHFSDIKLFNLARIDTKKLKSKSVYAYSHEENRILGYKKWSLYSCIVAEIEIDGECFVLSGGEWRKVDDDFYKAVNEFIENTLVEIDVDDKFHNVDISDADRMQNREEVFNRYYCDNNPDAILFDKAKLRIGQGKKENEFCDVLELNGAGTASIIHVKRYGGSSSINYLFSQANFYCDFFLADEVFLAEIREHIANSNHDRKGDFLTHVKEELADVAGKDYEVNLWILYDNKRNEIPNKSRLPLMAKYEIKLTYDRLRNINKFSAVNLSMIPVKIVNFETAKKKA